MNLDDYKKYRFRKLFIKIFLTPYIVFGLYKLMVYLNLSWVLDIVGEFIIPFLLITFIVWLLSLGLASTWIDTHQEKIEQEFNSDKF